MREYRISFSHETYRIEQKEEPAPKWWHALTGKPEPEWHSVAWAYTLADAEDALAKVKRIEASGVAVIA
jgi:hypothetical protein